MKITITIGSLSMDAELNDTTTARLVGKALPFTTRFATWGDEIYFSIPVDSTLDDSAKEIVEMGDLGYWPSGKAFCIFFGPTPMSGHPGEIVPASAVNIIGKVLGDPKLFKEVMDKGEVRVEAAGSR
ncbi:MAG: cyclophilin-like fold protein [Desulfomonilaceae bacterium]|nr:cyclophilin-like fold protein [Desulfomonilaceae bacterium]